MTLEAIWFALIGVLFAGYAVLDGFDLGVGALYPFIAKTDDERTSLRHSIGPFWDGNEVWLLTAGGALFAAFPAAYATVFSGFYLALMLVLFALIFRAVSLEFRSRDAEWGRFWDGAFFAGSALPALLYGVAVGNVIRGVPLTADGEFGGTFFTLLNPYALLVGVLGLLMILTHGAAWAAMKGEGALRDRARSARSTLRVVLAVAAILVAVATAFMAPDFADRVSASPLGWLAAAIAFAGLGYGWFADRGVADVKPFLASAATVAGLVGVWAAGMFPYLLPSLGGPGEGLTVLNASSSQLTLTVMLIIALVGVPVVLAYTAFVYKTFSGKTHTGAVSY